MKLYIWILNHLPVCIYLWIWKTFYGPPLHWVMLSSDGGYAARSKQKE